MHKKLKFKRGKFGNKVNLVYIAGFAVIGVVLTYFSFATAPLTPVTQTTTTSNNAANYMIVWYDCNWLSYMGESEMQMWKSRGVGGFTCGLSHMPGLGGSQYFKPDPNKNDPLAGPQYDLQKRLRDSQIVEKLHRNGMKIYFGSYMANYYNPKTPFGDWYDDSSWTNTILPQLKNLAAMAHDYSFDGYTLDGENYGGEGGRTHSWSWNYGGKPAGVTEAQVRAKIKDRGQQVMDALTAGYPKVELVIYFATLPDSWYEYIQWQNCYWVAINAGKNPATECDRNHADANTQINFWDGLMSSSGNGRLTFADAIFYKGPQGGDYDAAHTYNYNRIFAMMSQRMASWPNAASRINITPFIWIDVNCDLNPDGTCGTVREFPGYVASAGEIQWYVDTSRKWGMGGKFFDYSYNSPMSNFEYYYKTYTSAMQRAAVPGDVDNQAPTLTLNSGATASGGQINLAGKATDNLAVWHISWKNNTTGASGETKMDWQYTGPQTNLWETHEDYVGKNWQMNWSIGIPASAGNSLTITAYDIKGNTASYAYSVSGNGSTPTPTPTPTPPPNSTPTQAPSVPKPTTPPEAPKLTPSQNANIDGRNKIDIFDLSIMLSNWHKPGNRSKGDLNSDGLVNITDLSILLRYWGQ